MMPSARTAALVRCLCGARWAWAAVLAVVVAAPGLQAQIFLNEIVGGGDGTEGSADPTYVGISADTGFIVLQHDNQNITNTGANPVAVLDTTSPYVDSVFIIDRGDMPISLAGVIFPFGDNNATGDTWNHIIKDATHDIDKNCNDIPVGGISFSRSIGIHASAGITFDLTAIRGLFGADQVKNFSAFAGMDRCGGQVELFAIVSNDTDVIDSVTTGALNQNEGEILQLMIPDEALYLTLATGASNGGIGCAHGVFADPLITDAPSSFPSREASNSADPNICPPFSDGPITVTIREAGATGATNVTVTETASGPFTATDVVPSAGAGTFDVQDAFPTGIDRDGSDINAWLLLGPYAQPGGAQPTVDAIQADYLTDGGLIDELTVQPKPGDTVDTDYAIAASTGLITLLDDTINPGGIPTWSEWLDADGTINFLDYYGEQVDNMMTYAVTYIHLDEATDVQITLASDDSVQVLLDGLDVFTLPANRGVGNACNRPDVVSLGRLDAGTYQIMVKVFQGAGGHGLRLRLEDPFTQEPITASYRVSLDPAEDPYPFAPNGAVVSWTGPRSELAAGIQYDIEIDAGTVDFFGDAGGASILGSSNYTLTPGATDFGPFTSPALEHAHAIGAQCAGTSISSTGNGDLSITAGGADIWNNGDQGAYAYREVTGDFRAEVEIVGRTLGNNEWAKHGIMARQDCGPDSRHTYLTDQQALASAPNSTRLQYRPVHRQANGCVSLNPPVAVAPAHANVLRLDRVGNVFIGKVFDELGDFGGVPGEWVEVGRHDWGDDAPATINVGLAVTSHDGCNLITIDFQNFEVTEGTPPGAPDGVSCVSATGGGVDVTWDLLGAPGGPISIFVDGLAVGAANPDATSFPIPPEDLPAGLVDICVSNDEGSGCCLHQTSDEVYINCGGPLLDEAAGTGLGDGRVWMEDAGAAPNPFLVTQTGTVTDFTVGIPAGPIAVADTQLTEPDFVDNPTKSQLFATQRSSPDGLQYRIPVPVGSYDVTLLFAEGCCSHGCEDIPDPSQSASSCRVFDILVNGALVAENFSHHVEAQRALGNNLPNQNWGVAYAAGPYTVQDVGMIDIFLADLGGGTPPDDPSLAGIAIQPADTVVGPLLVRGDSDSNGTVELTDGLKTLIALYQGGELPECMDAADADDNGTVELTDAVITFLYLFSGGDAPAPPSPSRAEAYPPEDCGPDTSPDIQIPPIPDDDLGCLETAATCTP